MNYEETTSLINSIAALLSAIGWPILVLFLAFYFGAPLKKFINDIGEFSFKASASGLEASARRQQFEAAALLGAASASKSIGNLELHKQPTEENAKEIANLLSHAVEPYSLRKLSQSKVLWVDDSPSNNLYERKSLEALGIQFSISTTTEDALEKLRASTYDLIISDMSRPPDNRAGYTLLEKKTNMGDKTPFIIYAGSNTLEHKTQAREKGAIGSTNNPKELFQLVLSAINSG